VGGNAVAFVAGASTFALEGDAHPTRRRTEVVMVDDARRPEESDDAHPRTPYAEHEATYSAFLRLMKWSTAIVALILIGMALFLV